MRAARLRSLCTAAAAAAPGLEAHLRALPAPAVAQLGRALGMCAQRDFYWEQGARSEAAELSRDIAAEVRDALRGDASGSAVAVAPALVGVGRELSSAGLHSGAVGVLREAVALLEGRDEAGAHAQQLDALRALVVSMTRRKFAWEFPEAHPEEAVALFERLIPAEEEAVEADGHSEASVKHLCNSYGRAGCVLECLGRHSEAAEHHAKEVSLRGLHRSLCKNRRASALHNYARTLNVLEQYPQALERLPVALELATRDTDPDAPDGRLTCSVLYQLGLAHLGLASLDDAEAHLSRALKGFEHHYGSAHPATIRTLHALARTFSEKRSPLIAEGLFRSALVAAGELGRGDSDPMVRAILVDYAALVRDAFPGRRGALDNLEERINQA